MTDQAKIRTMKAVCWAGVAADALWTLALIFPGFFGFLTGRPGFEGDVTMRQVMGIGASLMAGWTLLLAWAARNPIERKGVMLLTFCPVITGLFIVALTGVMTGSAAGTWILVKLAVLGPGMCVGYYLGSTIAREDAHENNN